LLLLNDCPEITVTKFNNLIAKIAHLLSKGIKHGYVKIYLTVDPGNNDPIRVANAIKIIESMFSNRSKERKVLDYWKNGGKIKILLF